RDATVTGVQTCALPISLCVGAPACPSATAAKQTIAANGLTKENVFFMTTSSKMTVNASRAPPESPRRQIHKSPETWYEVKPASRSEERRVGKECTTGRG